MKTENMPSKECLAYTLEAAERYNKYLYDTRENATITPEAAINNAQIVFHAFTPADLIKRNTRAQLLASIRRELKEIAARRMDKDPEIVKRQEKYRSDMDNLVSDGESTTNTSIEKIDKILADHNLSIRTKYSGDNDLGLSLPGTYLHVELFGDIEGYAKMDNFYTVRLSREDECENTATFLKDFATILTTPPLQKELFDTWKDAVHKRELNTEEQKRTEEKYLDDICAIVYERLKTFAKDPLDLLLPDTLQ